MVYTSKQAEEAAVLQTANAICAAIRTAPKTKGQDFLETCIVTGDDLERLAVRLEGLGAEFGVGFVLRDAACVRNSAAVVLAGVQNVRRGLNSLCQYCGHDDCAACSAAGGECIYGPMDLGIALGSAVSLAADARVDNRIMFSAGRAAMDLHFLPEGYGCCIAIALSVSGKSPYFDRKSTR